MKKIILSIFMCLFTSLLLSACTGQNGKESQQPPQAIKTEPIITANVDFADSLNGILNKEYSILDKNKVYYIRSKDFQSIYFVGTVIKNGSQLYNAVWATNDIAFIGSGLVFSVNDFAFKSSGMGDGRTNREPITENDDGYSLINQKILNDMSNALK